MRVWESQLYKVLPSAFTAGMNLSAHTKSLSNVQLRLVRLCLILQPSLGTSGISWSLLESSTGWWVSLLRKIVQSRLHGDLSHFQGYGVCGVGGGFFSGGPCERSRCDSVPSLLVPHYLQWRRRGCREGLWAVLVGYRENHQEAVGFLCVFRNNCVFRLARFVAVFCSGFVDSWDQRNEIGKGLMILFHRRNIEFNPYMVLCVTPLIYTIAFYCLLNVAFKLKAFRWFMIFQKKKTQQQKTKHV